MSDEEVDVPSLRAGARCKTLAEKAVLQLPAGCAACPGRTIRPGRVLENAIDAATETHLHTQRP
jgi:hypothetical protein